MELQQLRALVAVAEELHFGRAAKRLHLTPSPVSRAVRDLEREIGTDLFVRRYHEVELTAAGGQLAGRAADLLRRVDELQSFAGSLAGTAARTLRLGGTHLAPAACLEEVIGLVEQVCPGRPPDVRLAVSAALITDVERGELDVALVQLPCEGDGLESLPIGRFPLIVAMRADDPLATSAALTLPELAARTLTLGPTSPHPVAMNGLRQRIADAGIRSVHEMPDHDGSMLAAHIRRTRGLTLTLPPADGGLGRVFDDPAFAVVPLDDDSCDLVVGLVWQRRRRDVAGALPELIAAATARWKTDQASAGATTAGLPPVQITRSAR